MLFGKKRVIFLVACLLLLLPLNAYALNYVATVQVSVEKSLYGPSEEVHVSGTLTLSNQSANDTSLKPVAGASVNFTIRNASGVNRQAVFNTTSDGKFRSRSDIYTTGIQVNAPAGDGYYNLTATYTDPDNVEWASGGAIKVFSEVIDIVSISTEKARYLSRENISVTLKALREVGDSKVALANVTINGSMRYNNRTTISLFSCKTGGDGLCITSVTAPTTIGTYLLEANNFLSTSSFKVVPFDTFVYLKDSTGKSFKEVFNANDVATVEVRVSINGSAPTGEFVFNGTITDSSNSVVTNISSTTLDSNNSYTNRFSFTISNQYTNGIYFAHVTAHQTAGGSGSASATTSFQVRSWTLTVAKAEQDSGFEYEYTTFPNKTVTLEIFPKERQNGTIITGLNYTQFNITLQSKTGYTLATGNASWNASCSSSGCYRFNLTTPAVAGSYRLSSALNYSNEVQTLHLIIGVTSISLSAIPSNSHGDLKELFGTTEFVYLSLSAKNETSGVNISDVVVESVIYENGTKYAFTEVESWSNVSSNNSVLEWALNASANRIKMDAPKKGGNYMVTLFVNNRSIATSTKFSVNPYSVCGAAKSTAGSVDSSSSFYVWQYKTTDTVYLELKIAQAKNGLGRAAASGNGSFSSNYGMGNACYVDTTKNQVITNATITIESVVNLQTAATASLNTSATYCSADDNQGTYTCTIKPTTKWDGGRYKANLKITGSDSETTDKAESVFEARAFYIWAWSNSWTNKPDSNLTFTVDMYEAGTNWWSNYGSGGINGEATVEKVEYNGKDGEWIWPPIDVKYNTTGVNSSTVTNGRGSVNISAARLPKGRWEPGYYVLTIKGTKQATGESDYGQAWFGVKQWDAYSSPIETSGSSFQYKNSFSTRENVSLYIRVTNSGDWNDINGGRSLGGNITIGVKKLQYYTSWPPTDLNSSAYTVSIVNVNASSPWYSSANTNTHSGYVMNISPSKGRWDGGYYNIVLDVNGTETGYGWFNVIAFNIDTQPTDSSGTYKYTNKGNGAVYFNISTTKNKKFSYSYYSSRDYINATIKDVKLSTWLQDTWETVNYNYPEDLNVSPMRVNGTTLVAINKSGNWRTGYYWGEITMEDEENSTSTGYLWFSVQPFRVETSANTYNIDTDSNASVNLFIREPDWSNNNVIYGNYTITQIYEDVWSGSGRSRTGYTNYAPSASQSFNGSTTLNITPATAWSSSNNGYHYLTVIVRDNSDNTTQQGWVSFRAVPFSTSIGSITNRNSVAQGSNIPVPVTVTKAVSGASTTANISRVYEWTWPTETEYGFTAGSCTSSAACQVTGTQNVTLLAPSGGWPSGWHYVYIEFMTASGGNKISSDSIWFRSVQPYDGYFSNYDSGYTNWKYYFGFTENLTIALYARDSNYAPQNVNVTKVEVSEDGDSCWYEGCKSYTNYSYAINRSSGNEIRGNGTIIIINNGSQWRRGQHSIKATVNGSLGTNVIQTGYVYVKDTSVPNTTIVSPQNGEVISNGTSFLFNATSNEDVICYTTIVNYDRFSQWYCGASNSSTAACNSTRFNGSTDYYQFVYYPPYGGMNTGGRIHYYNFSTATMTSQDYGISMWCYDIDWNYVESKVSFKLNLSQAASTPVTVNLSSPANASTINTSTATFAYNVSGTGSTIANCSVYINASNNWTINKTVSNFIGANITTQNTTTVSGFNNGTYLWNIYCRQSTNASNYAWAPANWTFSVANLTSNASNTTSVQVTVNLSSPANASTINASTATFSYNLTGTANAIANCSIYTNMSGWSINKTNLVSLLSANNNATNTTTITGLNNGTYIWNTHCELTTNTSNYAWAPANWTFSVANLTSNASNTTSIQVTVNLSSPANQSTMNTSNAAFTINITGTSTKTVNCSIYINASNNWTINKTMLTYLSGTNATNTTTTSGLGNGNHIWNAYCEETTNTSNYAWAPANFTFEVNNNLSNTTPQTQVTVNLSSPTNNTIQNTSTATFSYNLTGTANAIANCSIYTNMSGWSINKTNLVSLLSANNNATNTTTITGLNNGTYIWNTHCELTTNTSNHAWAPTNWTFSVANLTSNASNTTTTSAQVAVNLSSPANGSTISTNMVPTYNVSGPSLVNCSVWGNFTGSWLANITNNSISTGTVSAGTLFLGAGFYEWNTRCIDSTNASNSAWAPGNFTFGRNSS